MSALRPVPTAAPRQCPSHPLLRFLLRLRLGALARWSSATTTPSTDGRPVILAGNLHAHGYPGEAFDRLEILGEHGRVLLERDRLTIEGARPESVPLDLAANYGASYRETIACFLDGLASGRMAENRPQDNLETLRLVDEAYRHGSPT